MRNNEEKYCYGYDPREHCLPIAIIDSFSILNIDFDHNLLAGKRTIKDAISIAEIYTKPTQLVYYKFKNTLFLLNKLSRFRKLKPRSSLSMSNGSVIISLRSLSQLYEINIMPSDWNPSEGHWVVLQRINNEFIIIDRLAEYLNNTFSDTKFRSGNEVICQRGFNICMEI